MFSVKFQNGQFLGMSMSKGFIFAMNENFRYTFDSIAQIEKTEKYFCDCVGQSSFMIFDKKGNYVETRYLFN
jgi:hypothetical protein